MHVVLCSGDPDSLDGVYLPEKKLAWVDGTAPHVLEPKIFGLDGDYWNLGRFFSRPFTQEEAQALRVLQASYQNRYARAYACLSRCAGSVRAPAKAGAGAAGERIARLGRRIGSTPRLTRRFLSAVTCKGFLRLTEELDGMERTEASAQELAGCAKIALDHGWSPVLCPSPLEPEQPEALLLPEAGLAYTAFLHPEELEETPWSEAITCLREAKMLHDELEAIYKPHMDFSALTAYTDQVLEDIFA